MATPIVDFKHSLHKRLQREFEEDTCLILRSVLLWMSAYTMNYYGKPITVTTLGRTDAEQDDIYLNHKDPSKVMKYKLNPWKSYHQVDMAADLRQRVFDTVQWDDIIETAEIVFKAWGIKFVRYDPSNTSAPVHVEVHKKEN